MHTQNDPNKNKHKEQKDQKKVETPCLNCEKLLQEVETYKAKYLRALADYQNYERRMSNEVIRITERANVQLILKLLMFLDDLERAEIFVKDKNLSHIKDSFFHMLEAQGLEEIKVIGTEYDPVSAEVVGLIPGEKDGIVVEVTRKGYAFHGSIIRVAQVKVSKKS